MEASAPRLRPTLVDEICCAYKNVVEVMKRSDDLVEVEHVLRQVLKVKGELT